MSARKTGPVAATLRQQVRDVITELGYAMPKGFGVVTVGDGRLCSGFPAHALQEAGMGRVDHGEWPFVQDRPLRASNHCLEKAVGNVLLRIALERRDRAMEAACQSDHDQPWYVATTALGALCAGIRIAEGRDAFREDWDGLVRNAHQTEDMRGDTMVTIRAGGEIETITIMAEYPETIMQAMKGRPLRDLVALPDTGRAEIEADIDALTVFGVIDMADPDEGVKTQLLLRSGPLRCASRPPEGIDTSWLSVREEGMARLRALIEKRNDQ